MSAQRRRARARVPDTALAQRQSGRRRGTGARGATQRGASGASKKNRPGQLRHRPPSARTPGRASAGVRKTRQRRAFAKPPKESELRNVGRRTSVRRPRCLPLTQPKEGYEMSKKLFIGVVPVIAAFALAVTPMAAQAAEGHYFSGGLSQHSAYSRRRKSCLDRLGACRCTNLTTGGKVSCHNVIGAVEENPEPGGEAGPAGVGETQSFNPYECESEACTAAATGGGPATYISVLRKVAQCVPNTGYGTMTAPNVSTEEPLGRVVLTSGGRTYSSTKAPKSGRKAKTLKST